MAGGLLEVSVRGFGSLLTSISDAQLGNEGKRRIHDAVGAGLLARQRKRFLDATDPDGKPWPISFASLRRKASGKDGKTLFDTGVLFNSIQFGFISPDVSEIGTNVPYASKHQFGEDGLPVRQFLGFTQEDANIAGVIASKIVDDILEGN